MADAQLRIAQTPPVTTVSSTSNSDGWKYRRRFMLWITLFDMVVIVLALLFAKHESIGQIATMGGFASLTSIFGFYVAGAVWDDHSARNANIRGLQITTQAGAGNADSGDGGQDKGP